MTRQAEGWPDLLQAYLLLAAGRGAALPVGVLRQRLGLQLDAMMACGAAEPGVPLSVMTCSACYEGHTAEVDYDPATRRSSIFCAEAGRVVVPDAELATVQPNLLWLPDQLASAFRVRPSPPRRTLIDGAAWWLGDIVVGRTDVCVALAVGVQRSAEIQQLIDALQQRPPPSLGILLVAGHSVPAHVGGLTGYQPIPIEEVVRVDKEVLCADQARLEAWVRALLRGQARLKGRRGGRPSVADQVLSIFRERRQRGEPFINKFREAKGIRDEWLAYFPDQDLPAQSTVRAQLPAPVSQ